MGLSGVTRYVFWVCYVIATARIGTAANLPQNEPVLGYGFTNALPGLTFAHPVVVATAPGDPDRLFIVEKSGRIMAVDHWHQPAEAQTSVFLDLRESTYASVEAGMLGLAFHPAFAQNGRFFVYRVSGDKGTYDILSEFRCDPSGGSTDPNSETVLISQRDVSDTHNAGFLAFGPDGYLYLSMGDNGPVYPDTHDAPQAIDKGFFAGIIRIDVDKYPGNLPPNPHESVTDNYRIPRDNPFVGTTNFNGTTVDPAKVRTEYYAVGFRNPWRFAFDPFTGEMICADVGEGTMEEIDVVKKGGNYGWPYQEGSVTWIAQDVPDDLQAPVYEYQHGVGLFSGRVVIGGVVYAGTALPELRGKYVFSDYASGNVWALDYHSPSPKPEWLAARSGISSYGVDPADGSILAANHDSGRIERLVYVDPASSLLPRTLREVDAFADLGTLTPKNGLLPYEVNTPLWSDGAIKQRWFDSATALGQINFRESDAWEFPSGMVFVKHFDLELTNGVPSSRRRVETRFIVKTADDVYGLTYRWDAAGSNATLVPPQGATQDFLINDGGILRTQVWAYPAWNDCRTCHNREAGFILGFRTHQLNRAIDVNGSETNQLSWLAGQGIFERGTSFEPNQLPKLVAVDEPFAPAQYRVRSYLEANCIQCHGPGGRSGALWDARIATPLAQAHLIGAPPLFYPPPSKLIDPGNPANSYLAFRVSNRAPLYQMPPLATSVLDTRFLNVLTNWIKGFPSQDWLTADIGETLAEGSIEVTEGAITLYSAAAGVQNGSYLFAGKTAFGHTALSARVAELGSNAQKPQAGLMFRQELKEGAAAVALVQEGANLKLLFSPGEGAPFQTVATTAVTPGSSVKLVAAETVSAWVQAPGVAWQVLGNVSMDLGAKYVAGFCGASAGEGLEFSKARFEDVALCSLAMNAPELQGLTLPQRIGLSADVSPLGIAGTEVAFYNGATEIGKAGGEPWSTVWTNAPAGNAQVTAVLKTAALSLTSAPVSLSLAAPASQVWLKALDKTTLGDWQATYGEDSFLVPGVTNMESASVNVSLLQGSVRTRGETLSSSALSVGSHRFVSEIVSTSSVEIAFTSLDYGIHQAALYFNDWTGLRKSETVSFYDASDRELAKSAISANPGVYLPFAFRHAVKVRIRNSAGGEAYLTGIFVDPVKPISVEIGGAPDGLRLAQSEPLSLDVIAEAPGRDIVWMELLDNGEEVAAASTNFLSLTITNLLAGEHEFHATAYGTFGLSGDSDSVGVTVDPAPTMVQFLGRDIDTKGSWIGRYGKAGWWLASEGDQLPNSVELLPEAGRIYVFAESTDEQAALQRPGSADRLAKAYYGQEFWVNLRVRDNEPREVAFYALDWGNSHRAMQIRMETANGVILDSQEANVFDTGVYYRWRIQGEVRAHFISQSINAVLNGVFFDPEAGPYEQWLQQHFTGSELQLGAILLSSMDSDGDGVSNGLEYYLGTDPKSAADIPATVYSASAGSFTVRLSQRDGAPDVALVFEMSGDLANWTAVTPVSIIQKTVTGRELSFHFPQTSAHQFIRYSIITR